MLAAAVVAAEEGTIICGGLTTRRLRMPGCDGDNDGKSFSKMRRHPLSSDCDRTYHLYVPTSRCGGSSSPDDADDDATSSFAISNDDEAINDDDILPLVFALHGYTGSYTHFLHLTTVAESYDFVVVLPEGVQKSWNANECCGYALSQNVDDVGFLRRVVRELEDELSYVSGEVAYGVGHSNGAYMVTVASELFRAIAPVSGYSTSVLPLDVTQFPIDRRPTGLFLHHAKDDNVVRFGGCCKEPSMPRCCCDISSHSERCIDAVDAFHVWAAGMNNCTDMRVSYDDRTKGVTCHTGAGNGCAANATVCVHDRGGHFGGTQFDARFPMVTEILDFFGRDACSLGGGVWRSDYAASRGRWGKAPRCACPNDAVSTGTYCLGPGVGKGASEREIDGHDCKTLALVEMSSILALGLLLLILTRRLFVMSPKSDVKWTKVPVVEEEDVKDAGVELRKRVRQ